ncbi:hypothetical protein HYV81_00875 [Candidatus Woesearchaeota archaeon]|nr:hypothetical protein [Candidatus Woesearchaeota archaeon]
MKRGTAYASIGAVLGLLLVLVSFLFISISKEGITGAAVFKQGKQDGGDGYSENTDNSYLPEGTVRVVTNGKVLYVAKESMMENNAAYCSYGNTNEACTCPIEFDKRMVENYYMCVKTF